MKLKKQRNIWTAGGLLIAGALGLISCNQAEESTQVTEPEVVWTDLLADPVESVWQAAPNRKGSRRAELGTRWELKDGELSLDRSREGRGGSIETIEVFDNFEAKFTFKIGENCNSGIKYRHLNATGLEYQIIDDARYKDNSESHRTGEMYEMQEEENPRILKPAGEWNTGRIIAQGNHIEHWLNGQKVLDIEFGSDDWKARYEETKYFRLNIMDFGTHSSGIYIQDHSDTDVAFKSFLIRKL